MDVNKVMLSLDLLSIITLKIRSKMALRNAEYKKGNEKHVLFEHYDEYTLSVMYNQLDQLEKLLGNTVFDKWTRNKIKKIAGAVVDYLNGIVKARTGGLVLAMPANADFSDKDKAIVFKPTDNSVTKM